MPWETAVVDGRFYSQHPTAFTVAPCTDRSFAVTVTASGATAMHVEAAYDSTDVRTLRFIDAASCRPVLTVQESPVSSGRRWVAYWGRSTREKDRLFAAVEKSPFFSEYTTNVHVFLAGNSRERAPDFAVHGSFRGGAMTVSRGYDSGAAIALIGRETTGWGFVSGEPTYTLTINPYVDHAFILALTVMLHEMHHYRPRS